MGIAAAVAGIGCVYTAFRLKEPEKDSSDSDEDSSHKEDGDNEMERLLGKKLFTIPVLIYALGIVRLLGQQGWTMFTSMFNLFMIEKYDVEAVLLSTQTLGSSAFYVATTMFVFRRLVPKLDLVYCLVIGQILMATAYVICPLWDDSLFGQWATFFTTWFFLMP